MILKHLFDQDKAYFGIEYLRFLPLEYWSLQENFSTVESKLGIQTILQTVQKIFEILIWGLSDKIKHFKVDHKQGSC